MFGRLPDVQGYTRNKKGEGLETGVHEERMIPPHSCQDGLTTPDENVIPVTYYGEIGGSDKVMRDGSG